MVIDTLEVTIQQMKVGSLVAQSGILSGENWSLSDGRNWYTLFYYLQHWIKVWLENLFHIFGKIDLNFLMIITGFGIGVGLSIGLYSMTKQRR